MKRLVLIALPALAAALALGVSSGQSNRLSFFTWSDYIDPKIIPAFEKKFGVKVNLSLYESNEDMLAKLKASGKGQYDLIVPSDYIVPVLIRQGLLQKLNLGKIANFKNLAPQFVGTPADPKNEYGAGYQWGTTGILYRKDKVKIAPTSWAVIFDAKRQQGSFTMMDDPRVTIGNALKYLGKSLNSTNIADLKAAGVLLGDAKRRAKGLTVGIGGKTEVESGNVDMAVVFNGDGVRASSENKNLAFVVPQEGTTIALDFMMIPAGAPNAALAHQFINYVLDAKVGARLSNYTRFGTPNAAAKAFLNSSDLQNPGIYPPAATMSKLEYIRDLGKDSRLYDALWTKFKSK